MTKAKFKYDPVEQSKAQRFHKKMTSYVDEYREHILHKGIAADPSNSYGVLQEFFIHCIYIYTYLQVKNIYAYSRAIAEYYNYIQNNTFKAGIYMTTGNLFITGNSKILLTVQNFYKS